MNPTKILYLKTRNIDNGQQQLKIVEEFEFSQRKYG